jgi:hypothetical protein
MGAAVVGVVLHIHIPRFELVAPGQNQALHTFAHGTQVDGDMGGIGHQLSLLVEDGAGEIQSLFDVDGVAGVLQSQAHFVGHGAEKVVEDFQQHGVGRGGIGRGRFQTCPYRGGWGRERGGGGEERGGASVIGYWLLVIRWGQ